MSYKVTINGKTERTIKDGFVISEEGNETLNAGTIILCTDVSLNLVPHDFLKIDGDNIKTKYRIVGDYTREIVQFEPKVKYEYTINTISETKLLELVDLPNISITRNASKPKSVYQCLYDIFTTYFPKIRVKDLKYETPWYYDRKIKIDLKLSERFGKIECPEFSWNEPTLREVLDDLLMVDDCIAIVENGVLHAFDLKKKGQDIDFSKLSTESRSMALADYVSDLNITMKNSIGENLVSCAEYKSLRSDGGEITTDNMIFRTQHPIYSIKSFKLCYMQPYITLSGSGTTLAGFCYVENEVSRLIKEQDEFETLDAREIVITPSIKFDEAEKYQKFCLYFKRGDNKIQNFGSKKFFTNTLLQVLQVGANSNQPIHDALINEKPSAFPGGFDKGHFIDQRNIMVKIEYETLDDRKMKVGKYLPVRHQGSEIFDNQTSSYVNVQQQSLFEYAKANRLGNEIINITGVYKKESDVPEIFDRIDENILFNRELSYYDGYIMFKGNMTKKYILKNYFTGIKSKRREWQIAKGSEALTRYDVTKLYAEFSKHIKKDKFREILQEGHDEKHRTFVYDLLLPFTDIKARPALHAVVSSIQYGNIINPEPSKGVGYDLDLNVEAQGQSLCFNFGFYDNYAVDSYIVRDGKLYRNGIYRYCDNNGEFMLLNFNFYKDIDPTDGEFVMPQQLVKFSGGFDELDALNAKLANMAGRKPLIKKVEEKELCLSCVRRLEKDNREIIKHTLQIEFCSDDSDFIVTPLFVKRQRSLRNYDASAIHIYASKGKYDPTATKVLGKEITKDTQLKRYVVQGTIYTSVVYLTLTGSEKFKTYNSWGIADDKGNLIFGANQTFKSQTFVYINLIQNRDDNVYDADEPNKVIGKMWEYE